MRIAVLKNLIAGKPILVIFDVTKLCNERCPMCNIWKTKSADMTLAQIQAKARELRAFGIGYVFIQGGEPTLRNDLIPIVDSFIQNSIKPTVITNGILLTPARAAQLAERHCNVAISLDSLQKDRFARLRGVDALETVRHNLESITTLVKKGNWSITTTVSSLSDEEDIFAIKNYAHDHGYMHAIRPYTYVSGQAGKNVEELHNDQKKVIAIFERYAQDAKRENYLAYLIYHEHLNYLHGRQMPMCDAMKYSFVMQETGTFSPCIEYPRLTFNLPAFSDYAQQYSAYFRTCNAEHPCFYNDAREIGILWRKKYAILLHFPQILKLLLTYGNFF